MMGIRALGIDEGVFAAERPAGGLDALILPPAGGVVPDFPDLGGGGLGRGLPDAGLGQQVQPGQGFVGHGPDGSVPVGDGGHVGGQGLEQGGAVMVQDHQRTGEHLRFQRAAAQAHMGETR